MGFANGLITAKKDGYSRPCSSTFLFLNHSIAIHSPVLATTLFEFGMIFD